MTPRKDKGIAMMTLAELMGPWPKGALDLALGEDPPAEIKKARVKVHQDVRRAAMLQQRNPKVEAFPVGNRAARRLAGSKKAEKPL